MSTVDTSDIFVEASVKEYTRRAKGYDAASGGWHGDLAEDFVRWLPPPSDDAAVLDLACGTGLVTLAWAKALGPRGLVLGVDITQAMLDEATQKTFPEDGPAVKLVRANIMGLSTLPQVQEVVETRGGFDIISLCSALALLESPAKAIGHWAKLLKPGSGRIIIDVPTEDRTLLYLLNHRLRRAIGKPIIFDGNWTEGKHTLTNLFQDAGLDVEQLIETRSYLPERTYLEHELWEAFDSPIGEKTRTIAQEDGRLDDAKQAWEHIWQEHLKQGKLWDGHKLYVGVARRPTDNIAT